MSQAKKGGRKESGSTASNGNGKSGFTVDDGDSRDYDDGRDYGDDYSSTNGTSYGHLTPSLRSIHNKAIDLTGSTQPYSSGSTATHASVTNTQNSELEGLIGMVKELTSSFTSAMKQVQHPSSTSVQQTPHGYPLEDYNRISPQFQHANHYQHANFYPQPNFYQQTSHLVRPELYGPVGMTQADVLRIFSQNDRENFEREGRREERRYQFHRTQREKENLVNILQYFPR